jgi:hypothetical protein
MARAFFVRLLVVLLLLGIAPVADAAAPPVFSTEQAAQQHCPKDTVVWLNLPSGIYHFKGQRWYGHTKNGAFACKKEADQAGDRGTRNGQ